ncbi:MAG: acetyl-CoA hydrolase/transferase C-terminal domain-containing protein [Clostridia bacterium]
MKENYNEKLITAEIAATKIKSGDRVLLGHAVAEPSALINEIVDKHDNYKNVELVHLVYLGNSDYLKYPESFIDNSLFMGAGQRKYYADGVVNFTPCFFNEVPKMLDEEYLPVDVFAFQCAPPDENGYINVGVSADYGLAAIKKAKMVIAELNPQMPRTAGDGNSIHVSEIDYMFEVDRPLFEIGETKIGDIERQIGAHIAKLIPDGATLQLGIGSIPDAILEFLKDKKDLGIHTEMLSDGIVDLVRSGAITGNAKNTHKGKIVTTFIMGTKKLYDFCNNNPDVEVYGVDYTNNPYVIAQNDNMISVNACIQVDLMGQVIADNIGLKQFSGVGGQVDFVRGANMSKGGKAIIAMASTAARGTISKIVPFLDHGGAVTTSRFDVSYIVTEYGVAELRGKTLKQRARALINIAHPDFREELEKEFEVRFKEKL